jgi:uncharacterized metal-binding protein YceD (DUF177 family)
MSALEVWHHKIKEIPRAGITQHREADQRLRSGLAKELDTPDCHSLVAEYTIRSAAGGRYELKGRVEAEFTRTCVVSLEPLRETVAEPIDCTFAPPEQLPGVQAEEESVLSLEELEPIENGMLEVGRVIYETIAASLDPYPRAPDAAYEPSVDAEHELEEHPFAKLSRLKSQRKEPS